MSALIINYMLLVLAVLVQSSNFSLLCSNDLSLSSNLEGKENQGLINSNPIGKECEKNPRLGSVDVKGIRKWLDEQSHLPKVHDSDIGLFLHSNDYDIDKAKMNIENYFTMRSHLPEFFSYRDAVNSKELKKIFDIVSVVPLEELTEQGYRVLYTKLMDPEAKKYTFNTASKYFNMVMDQSIYKDGTNAGYLYVFDLGGTNLDHAARLSPTGLKKFLDYSSKGAPIKWKGLHYLAGKNSSFNDIIRDFVKTKSVNNTELVGKLYFHNDLESLINFVPIKILPTEMGGSAGSLESLNKETKEKLEKDRTWFLNTEEVTKIKEKSGMEKPEASNGIFRP